MGHAMIESSIRVELDDEAADRLVKEERARPAHRLVNTPRNPATAQQIVEAALAYANGATVRLVQEASHIEDARRHAIREFKSGTLTGDERSALVDALVKEGGFREGFRRTLECLLEQKRGAATKSVAEFVGRLSLRGVEFEKVPARADDGGLAIRPLIVFRSATSIAEYGLLLVGDDRGPYRALLSRCRQCEAFYIASKNPRGGGYNRTYCTPEHLKLWHDGGRRTAARRGQHGEDKT